MSFIILNADARRIPLKDKSVQCVVTSPPYWGLRDYGTATWVGGDEGCDHKQTTARHDGGRANVDGFHGSLTADSDKGAMNYRDQCKKCGATRIDSQIGLEKSPEEYVAKIVAVFAEVWRVLRDDGTCWVNLGDSYAQGGKHRDEQEATIGEQKRIERQKIRDDDNGVYTVPTGWGKRGDRAALTAVGNLKPKDLVGIPWRIAFALQAAGWYLRSDIIWSKPNPMPESVTDRPTKAHEYIFLLTKKERYFFDGDAVREPAAWERWGGDQTSVKDHPKNSLAARFKNKTIDELPIRDSRNIRTVWEIATQPYPEAHFATFPEEIAIRCIKAGSKINSIILDPFSGAGTVPLVADKLNRRGIGLELKSDYCRMAHDRCYDDAPLLVTL